MDENWQSRGVEIDNHQWRELIEKLAAIDGPGPYERALLAALPAFIALGLDPDEACKKAHECAMILTMDE